MPNKILLGKKQSMKKGVFIFIFLCVTSCSFGQASIEGKITDRLQALPGVTVLLLKSDSVLVKGVVTDIDGKFVLLQIAPGNYMVSSSMVGYSKSYSPTISVGSANVILPDITLEQETTTLNEVTVKAEKPMFEQQTDRLVVNVQSSITSSGNTILEILQKSPGIVVNRQSNSIVMNGKSGVRVMINDKMMQVPLDVAVQMLDGMNSSNVEKIELITSPPSKYDAEGNAGIIRIVTKANTDLGTNGTVGLTLGAHWAEAAGANLSLSHRTKSFATFLDYSFLRNHNLHTSHIGNASLVNGFTQTTNDDSHRENVTTQQNISTGFEWYATRNTTINFGVTGYLRDWSLSARSNDINYAGRDSTVSTHLKTHESNVWQSAATSIGLQTKINTKSDFGFSLDYLYYNNDNPSDYNNQILYEQRNTTDVSKIDLKKTTPIRFLVAKADYQYYFSPSLTMEAGIKGVTSHLENNVVVKRLVNSELVLDPNFTSYSNLNEQIGAAYISTKWKPANRWQINSGLRYEYTHTLISTPTQEGLVNRKYGYFFPNIFLSKELGQENDFQLSYTRRITRPTYNDIAPYVFFWGPNTFFAGNTSLFPAVSDMIKAAYHVKQWNVSLQFSHSKNEINSLQPEKDAQSNSLIYRSQNLKYLNTVGLTNSYSIGIASWWEMQGNVTTLYQVAQTSHLPTNVNLSLYGLNMNLVTVFKLPKDVAVEISGFYQSTLLAGIARYLPQGSLNVGVQKKFGEQATLKLSMDDILYTNYWRIRTNLPQNNLNTYFNYDFHNQFIRMTYSYRFGNNKLRSVRSKSGSDDERRRVTN